MKPLGKSLGAPALFGIVQGFVAASVYFAVGLVAQRALGFTWVVFLAGGLLFAMVVLSYVEGASLFGKTLETVLAERPCRVIIESSPDGSQRQRRAALDRALVA